MSLFCPVESGCGPVAVGKDLQWRTIPHLGGTAGDLTVYIYMVPTLDVSGQGALRIGIAIDGQTMQTLTDRLMSAPVVSGPAEN